MIRIEIKFVLVSSPIEIICDDYSEIFNHLERSKDVEAYKAFNGQAQFLPQFGYSSYEKLVQYWKHEKELFEIIDND